MQNMKETMWLDDVYAAWHSITPENCKQCQIWGPTETEGPDVRRYGVVNLQPLLGAGTSYILDLV